MKLSSVLFLIVYSVCITVITGGVSLSKPGCPKRCGNVTIPYPFGIGSQCSANKFFTVICNQSTNPPKPYLNASSNVGLEVDEFSLDKKIVRVKQGVIPLLCNTDGKPIRVGELQFVDIRDKSDDDYALHAPFRYSTLYNSLVVIGCRNMVWLPDLGQGSRDYSGCAPICGRNTQKCTGVNCCQTTIPSLSANRTMFYTSQSNGKETVCGYVFISDHKWLARDYVNFIGNTDDFPIPANMSFGEVPLIFEWDFEIPAEDLRSPVTCKNETVSYSASLDGDGESVNATRCYCEAGYEGNPYLPQGCQDIDECNINNLCQHGDTCVNKVGSFICKRADENRMKGTIIGLSSATGALVLLGGAGVFSRVIRKRIKANRRKACFKRNGGLLLQQQLSSSDGGVENIRLFDAKELAQATDRYNENRILGRGGQGTVYKGMLRDGRIVAVKKSKKVDEAEIVVFINEVVILSQINHRNIVKLLGCCLETQVPLLVYEFVPNGTLFQHIHDQSDDIFPLSWKMRLRIATEIAEALSYLHYTASVPIYHRDIKSTNILLDEKYRAKVSDFGTSRSIAIDQTHLTTRVLGTFGYLDPEYFRSSHFTEKSDVYSFGVVMVELLTGEKAITAVKDEAGRGLAMHFLHAMEENNLYKILDQDVVKEGGTENVTAVARLAMRCLNLKGKKRPTMKEVAAVLEGIQMPKDGSALQYDEEHSEFHSSEVSEDYDFPSNSYDFPSTSDNTNSKGFTAESLAKSPLLLGNT